MGAKAGVESSDRGRANLRIGALGLGVVGPTLENLSLRRGQAAVAVTKLSGGLGALGPTKMFLVLPLARGAVGEILKIGSGFEEAANPDGTGDALDDAGFRGHL